MRANHVLGSLLLFGPFLAQAQETKKVETTGELRVEGRKADVNAESAKLNEYGDIRNGFPLYNLGIDVHSPRSGFFLNIDGKRLLRDDQSMRLGLGKLGLWSFVLDRNETPHNLSLKAQTPFLDQGNGIYSLAGTAPIPNKHLAPTAAQLLANDAATAAWLPSQLHSTRLGTQRDRTGAIFSLTPTERLKIRLVASDERRDGTKVGAGPIGDRPPRTLNAQLALPVDFSTREVKLETEYNHPRFQAAFAYGISKFENGIDTFRWQNIYASGPGTFEQWTAHRVATFGQQPLAPDNQYRNATLSLGVNLPWSSRLSLSAAIGKMEQDQQLLPYASSSFSGTTKDFSSTGILPRASADAKIDTTRVNVEYSVNPISRLNLRAYLRYYDLDNRTPQDQWWYITSDTIGGASTTAVTDPTYKNQRLNTAYSFKQTTRGLEGQYSFRRASLGLAVEQEDMDRTSREADTKETTFKGNFRIRPTDWLSLRGKYLHGDRDGDYDHTVTRGTYWYDPAGRDLDNPVVTFSNHPDMRKFDVADRQRRQWDLSAILSLRESLDISFSYRDRKDDFDSSVQATQPLLGNTYAATDADRNAWTPGTQLGLLRNDGQRYAVDISYSPTEHFVLNAFASRDTLDLTQRGLEFNENNKLNPTVASLNTQELGPWTRAEAQWMAVSEDRTDTWGVGFSWNLVPDKVRLTGDFTDSNGTVDIAYSGFGAVSSLNPANPLADNYQFGFRTPPTVRNRMTALSVGLEYKATRNFGIGARYSFDRYQLSDWMQEENTPWFGSLGSQYYLRDSSYATSNQWGNRLISLGSYLSPNYKAHFVSLSASYRF